MFVIDFSEIEILNFIETFMGKLLNKKLFYLFDSLKLLVKKVN
jgi:hypothetical protein